MKEDQLNNFDFLDEISKGKTYSLLFPFEEDGIVIAQLYENVLSGIYEDEQFTGEDIHNIYKNYPNSIINKEKLINYDMGELKCSERIHIRISYNNDIDLAKKIMQEECEKTSAYFG